VGRPALENQGAVVFYLQPFPQGTQNLRFTVQSLMAVRPDGDTIPLNLNFRDFSGSVLVGRQRRLVEDVLPPGNYRGIRLQIEQAFLLGEEGETAMLLSEAVVEVDKPFEVLSGRASALFLSLDSSGIRPGDIVFQPVFSLAESGRLLINLHGYASNAGSNLLTVYNKFSMQVTASVATGRGPAGMAVDRRRGRLFVACQGDDRIDEINIRETVVTGRIELRLGDQPRDVALSPDGRLLAAVNYGSNSLSIVDPRSRIELQRVSVGRRPTDVAVDPSGNRAFVVNSLSNSISVVELARSAVIAELAVEATPLQAAVEPRSGRLFVIHRNSPNLLAIDLDTLAVVEKIFAGLGARSLTADPQTGLVYVGYQSGEISVVDPTALMFIDAFSLASRVADLAIDDQENSLFALQPDQRKLVKINLTSKRTLAELEVGADAYAVAVVGQR
jgi:YVTN family beta-propeller protein